MAIIAMSFCMFPCMFLMCLSLLLKYPKYGCTFGYLSFLPKIEKCT